MTTNHVALSARELELADGTHLTVWDERNDTAVTVVARDRTGFEVGRAHAELHPTTGAAQLELFTAQAMRRRGVALSLLESVVAWAQDRDVPYLVGEVAADEPTRAFIARCGRIVSLRTTDDGARFALLVPARVAAAA